MSAPPGRPGLPLVSRARGRLVVALAAVAATLGILLIFITPGLGWKILAGVIATAAIQVCRAYVKALRWHGRH